MRQIFASVVLLTAFLGTTVRAQSSAPSRHVDFGKDVQPGWATAALTFADKNLAVTDERTNLVEDRAR